VLASLIAGLASGEAVAALRNAKKAAVVYAIAGLAAIVGVVFLLMAGYIAAARRFGAVEAGLGLGGAFILLAILIVIWHRFSTAILKSRATKKRHADMTKVGIATGIALLPTLLKGRVGTAILAAPAIAAAAYAFYRFYSRPASDDDTDE
jgi:hypothetical protein